MSEKGLKLTAGPFKLRRGNSPLLVSMPHVGTHLPDWLVPRLTGEALAVPDTDWHLEELYDFLEDLDATVIIANYSRYVVDLNRPANNASLYPGQSVTGLCPLDSFASAPLYQDGAEPDEFEVRQRVEVYWRPYHQMLAAELSRLKCLHGSALLWDAHSIHSEVPRFFEGELPHLNVGTADNAACTPELTERITEVLENSDDYTWVVNGRFKGGYITRHYGQPSCGVNAVQMEIAMRAYMDEAVPASSGLDKRRARQLRPLLKAVMKSMLNWHKDLSERHRRPRWHHG